LVAVTFFPEEKVASPEKLRFLENGSLEFAPRVSLLARVLLNLMEIERFCNLLCESLAV
jgi:hypothetical protein